MNTQVMPTTRKATGSPGGKPWGSPAALFQHRGSFVRDLTHVAEFCVGTWIVQPRLNLLLDGRGGSRRIEPRAMEVLVYMAQHPDEVLSKNRILRAVWHDTCGAENCLPACISDIRRAFREDLWNDRYIQTIPKRGYRLTARVSGLQEHSCRHLALERIVAAVRGGILQSLSLLAGALGRVSAGQVRSRLDLAGAHNPGATDLTAPFSPPSLSLRVRRLRIENPTQGV
jgi:DNA-binding winged helix-turn-helix (wHTH) protein